MKEVRDMQSGTSSQSKASRANGVTRALRWATAAFALATTALVSGQADGADACISDKAKSTVAECPGGKLQGNPGKKPQVSFKSAPQAVSLKKRDDTTKPTNPTEQMNAAQRDERRNRLAARSRQLLVTEIQGLESLFSSTPKSAPDRPKLMRRLAEGYVELESAAFRDKTENEIKADEAKRKNPGAQAGFRAEAAKADKILKAARQAAIKYYGLLKDQYPKWCQNNNAADPTKSTGCTDEVLYYLAYEYEQVPDLEKARKVYFELIQSWPQSKFIPNAYLAFGELFFNEAQGDPGKWAFAEQSYKEVVKYPPPENKVFGYAHYKLGYVYWNLGDYAKALSEFKKTIDFGMQYSQLPNAAQLAVAARRDMVPVYALAGDPRRAYDFFKPIAGDSGANADKTYKMMDDLGQAYLDTGHYKEGIALYQDLMNRDRGPNLCVYQGHITEATLAMKSGNKDTIKAELDHQLEVHDKYLKSDFPADAKQKCSNITAGLLTETAMAWHLEAVGSGGVRGTGDKKTMKLAADLYQSVVGSFTQDQFAKFEFPRIVKEDWPNIFKIKYAMADLLYFQKDWAKCGPAFDSVVAENPNAPEAAEAAYASVLCYQNIYTETHKGGADKKGSGNLPSSATGKDKKGAKASDAAKYAPKDFTDNQKGMITAFNRYVCYIKPAENDKEAQEQYVEVKYARARTYFEAQHWEEAAVAFRDVALNNSDKEVGIFATQLYLESLNVVGAHSDPPRPTCYDDMAQDVPKFIELYCSGGKEKDNAEQCGILIKIQRDIERLRAEKMVEAADRGGADSLAQYAKAGDLYFGIWKKYGEPACPKDPACERSEEVLYNAARAYQAGRLIAKAIAVRRVLINPDYGLEKTELARKAVYEIGGNYQAIAVYDEAATWYERFAKENPKMDKAAEALQDAVVLRLGLGQEDQAIADAQLFNKNYGSKNPAQVAKIAFAISSHYVEREDWDKARKSLSGAIGQVDKSATLDVKVQAHAMLGLVYTKTKSVSNAVSEYNKVRGYWKDPAAAARELDAIGGDDGEKVRRLGKVLTSVGEALFFFAEQRKVEVDKIKFPEYKGSGEKDDVLKHINTKVADWVKKKRAAIEGADLEYQKIVKLEPVPPPKWVIASGARVGQMWGKFVAEFRAAPIPAEWKKNGPHPLIPDLTWEDIRGNYYAALDEASEPQKLQAKAAFKTCLDLSVQHQYFDDFSRSCEVWLSKNYSSEYHLIDEFRGSPSRVNSGLSDRPSPLNLDGTPYRADVPAPPPPAKPAEEEGDGAPKAGVSKEKAALDAATTKSK